MSETMTYHSTQVATFRVGGNAYIKLAFLTCVASTCLLHEQQSPRSPSANVVSVALTTEGVVVTMVAWSDFSAASNKGWLDGVGKVVGAVFDFVEFVASNLNDVTKP